MMFFLKHILILLCLENVSLALGDWLQIFLGTVAKAGQKQHLESQLVDTKPLKQVECI